MSTITRAQLVEMNDGVDNFSFYNPLSGMWYHDQKAWEAWNGYQVWIKDSRFIAVATGFSPF